MGIEDTSVMSNLPPPVDKRSSLIEEVPEHKRTREQYHSAVLSEWLLYRYCDCDVHINVALETQL
jgi:hypothetical protein